MPPQYPSLSQMNLCNLEVAQRRLLKRLIDKGFHLKIVAPINNNRYSIIKFQEKTILLMFKKEPFMNFGSQFWHLGQRGVGDSLNLIDFNKALDFDATEVYSIFPNGICYSIPIMDFINKGVYWRNKEGKEILSISIHNYKRQEDLS